MSTVITLLTDFGPGSVYVGQMHATLARLAPEVRVLDLAHDCPRGGIEAAAYVLRRSVLHCPPGAIHVVVVDPGVGSERALVAVRTGEDLFVAPDNGVLASVLPADEAYRIESRALMTEPVSSTFHGRDILAPVAAKLATGTPLAEVGPPYEPMCPVFGPKRDVEGVTGRVLVEDRFGNLITNVPRSLLEVVGGEDRAVRVRVGPAFIHGLARTFSDVPLGVALAYVGSGDHLEIAVSGGRAGEVLGLRVGDPVRVEPMRERGA